MILDPTLTILKHSKLKELEDGGKYYSVLVIVKFNDRDFGIGDKEVKVPAEKDLSAFVGKKVRASVEIYYSKKNNAISFRIIEVLNEPVK